MLGTRFLIFGAFSADFQPRRDTRGPTTKPQQHGRIVLVTQCFSGRKTLYGRASTFLD